jgi:hypothetical protein
MEVSIGLVERSVFETGTAFNHTREIAAYTRDSVPVPRLTFFVELPTAELVALFARPGVADALASGGHALSMGMLDLTPERAELVRSLEARGVAVTAWLLLDPVLGYWLTADNAWAGAARYRAVRDWANQHKLELARVGLDIEPPKKHLDQLLSHPLRSVLMRVLKRRPREAIAQAEALYRALVDEIHADGRSVESYQFPLLLDERKAGSSLLRRTLGLVEVPADAEVFMLYRSYLGGAFMRSYFAEARAIALGVTGGGVNADKPHIEPKVRFEQLEVDLRTAAQHTRELYVFSLEGCVEQGMLPRIAGIDWDAIPALPSRGRRRARGLRGLARLACRSEALVDRLLGRPRMQSLPPPPLAAGQLREREGEAADEPGAHP